MQRDPEQERHDPEKSMIRRPVPPALVGSVTDIVHYRETFLASARQVETASLVIPLVIVLGDRFRIGLGREPRRGDEYASFTAGLFAGPVIIRSLGEMECVQVNFTPLGARRLLALPMRDVSARMIDMDSLSDGALTSLRDRLGALPAPSARLDMVTSFLMQRLASSVPEDRTAEAAYRMMGARHGDIRIADLAARLDVSRKHLAERFRDAIGLPPKAVARIMRFNAAQSLAATGCAWADIAFRCGYADQAHLARDFVDLSGSTPTAWRNAA